MLNPDVLAAFEGLAPEDTIPREPADPDALEALRGMIGRKVTFRDWEITETGLREIETEAVLFSMDGDRRPSMPPNKAA